MRMRGILNCQDMMLNQYNVISSMGMRSVLDSQDMVLYQDYVVSRMRVRGVLNDERDPCRRRRCAKIDSEHRLLCGGDGEGEVSPLLRVCLVYCPKADDIAIHLGVGERHED